MVFTVYVIFKTETKEMMGNIALKIRSIEGVIDSLTCYVVSLSDIRPEARARRGIRGDTPLRCQGHGAIPGEAEGGIPIGPR